MNRHVMTFTYKSTYHMYSTLRNTVFKGNPHIFMVTNRNLPPPIEITNHNLQKQN